MTINSIPFLIISMILFLFLYVAVQNLKKNKIKENFLFILMIFSIIWWQFSDFLMQIVDSKKTITFLAKNDLFAVIWLPVFFYHFSSLFVSKKVNKLILYIFYGISTILSSLVFFSNNLVSGYWNYTWGVYPKVGNFNIFFIIYVSAAIILTLWNLFQKYKKTNIQEKKEQIKMISYAIIIFSFVVVDFLPKYGWDIYPVGVGFVLIFLAIIYYTISKYNLISIRKSSLKTIFILVVVSITLYISIYGILFLESIYIEPNMFSAKILIMNILITPFYVFGMIFIYTKIVKISSDLFKSFNSVKKMMEIMKELALEKRSLPDYLQEKLSLIYKTDVAVICKKNNKIFLKSDNKFDFNSEEVLDLLSKKNELIFTNKEELLSFMPTSKKMTLVNILNKNKIKIGIPVNENLAILVGQKNENEKFEYGEVNLLKSVKEEFKNFKDF